MTPVVLPFHRRLSFRLACVAALTSALGLAAVSSVLIRQERVTLTEELTLRALSEARNLALASSAPLLRHDPELGLHPLILRALEEFPDLEDLVIADSRGAIVGHEDLLQVGDPITLEQGEPLAVPSLRAGEVAHHLPNAIVLRVPVQHLDEVVGTLVATVGRHAIDTAVRQAMLQAAGVSAVGVLGVILLIVFLVARSLAPVAELRAAVQRIGSGDLATRIQLNATNELGMLADLIDDMTDGLAEAQTQRLQKERIDHELRIAHDLQTILLPKRIPSPAGYTVATHYQAALEVSGDYYDIIDLDRGRYAVILGDVSGKGVPGLVIMAMLRTVARQLALAGADPAQLLVQAHDILRPSIPRGMFITCLCGILDTRTHHFEYANAGHCPPIVFGGSDGAHYLPVGGKPLGMFTTDLLSRSLQPRHVALEAGEGLLIYSDGLTEAMNGDREQLGEPEVLRALSAARTTTAEDSIQLLRQRVSAHQQNSPAADDLTLFACLREGAVDRSQAKTPITRVEEIFT